MAQRQFDHKVKPGDLIEIERGVYQHWAVYIGGYEVVHLVTADHSSGVLACTAEVRRDTLQEVVGYDKFNINNLLDDKYVSRDPAVIVKDACSMVGRSLPYDVATRNCEHFVTELRYGKAASRQVKAVGDAAAVIGGVALGVAGLVALGAFLFSGSSEKEEEKKRDNRTRQRNSRGSRNQHWHHHC